MRKKKVLVSLVAFCLAALPVLAQEAFWDAEPAPVAEETDTEGQDLEWLDKGLVSEGGFTDGQTDLLEDLVSDEEDFLSASSDLSSKWAQDMAAAIRQSMGLPEGAPITKKACKKYTGGLWINGQNLKSLFFEVLP